MFDEYSYGKIQWLFGVLHKNKQIILDIELQEISVTVLLTKMIEKK